MKNLVVLCSLIVLGFFCDAKAQSFPTKILRIEVDQKEIKTSYDIYFLAGNRWIKSEKISSGFIIPNQLKNKEYLTVLIAFDSYKLKFSNIHISKFNQDWVVGIDKKPFSEELASSEENQTTERINYIEFESDDIGTQLIVKERKAFYQKLSLPK